MYRPALAGGKDKRKEGRKGGKKERRKEERDGSKEGRKKEMKERRKEMRKGGSKEERKRGRKEGLCMWYCVTVKRCTRLLACWAYHSVSLRNCTFAFLENISFVCKPLSLFIHLMNCLFDCLLLSFFPAN